MHGVIPVCYCRNPIGFHPRSDSDIVQWQNFVRNCHCKTLFCFTGAPHTAIKNDFKGLLLNHCNNASGSYKVVDCTGSCCSNDTSHQTTYLQYQWFLPNDLISYSIFIHRDLVKNDTSSIKTILQSYRKQEINQMREKMIQYIPKLVYAKPEKGLNNIKDAFNIAIDGVLKRIKEQE
ncbi:hypothetical protein ES332_D04G165000v1 [Gossypium tomentosum]|uniref:Uncharacterized protein n=1 Tax=Gossypium tomentosum TaxID=34277 RepID=A0A5D2LE22_GOSTO|nr:hypothetical protein ES332_D04G165000v1 [Gossypium tomentosum]